VTQSDPAAGKTEVAPSPRRVVPVLGVTQILAWGSSYYLPAVLAKPVALETGWSLTWIVGGLSLGLLTAGLAAPAVGRCIHRKGGRPVLAASALLLAAGQIGLAIAPSLPVFVLAWIVIGFGMSAGLYDAAFSTLGQLYRLGARHHIGTLTLFGGFASTVCWPLSAFLVDTIGWRGACLAYAAIHLGFCLPLYLWGLPKHRQEDAPAAPGAATAPVAIRRPAIFMLLALAITLAAFISTVVSVHLLTILSARNLALAAAVALGAMVGPSQVGARFIEMLVARYHHPIWTKLASAALVAIGLTLLALGVPVIWLALICYGAGIGLDSIARATLPLALFGAHDYAPIMGKLARPALIVQAAAPSIGALLIAHVGSGSTVAVIAAGAILNVGIVLGLVMLTRQARLAPA